jgi:hypothetical protein
MPGILVVLRVELVMFVYVDVLICSDPWPNLCTLTGPDPLPDWYSSGSCHVGPLTCVAWFDSRSM